MNNNTNHPDSDWVSSVSQRKLRTSFGDGTHDNLSLHRWVLLKNLVAHAESSHSNTLPTPPPPFTYPSLTEEEVFVFPDEDVFVFPNVEAIVDSAADAVSAEARWLDALLEELDVDVDDGSDNADSIVNVDDDAPIEYFDYPTSSESSCDHFSPPSSSGLSHRASSAAVPPINPPSSLLELPYSLCDEPDLLDNGLESDSDDESDGPETPLMLSITDRASSEPLVYTEPESYFVYPFEPDPISPTAPHLFVVQDCS